MILEDYCGGPGRADFKTIFGDGFADQVNVYSLVTLIQWD